MMMNFSMTYGKLTLEEAFMGVTRNAAIALGRHNHGIISEGANADLIVWNGIDNLAQIPYYHYESS
jgi:imidazolonepropionase